MRKFLTDVDVVGELSVNGAVLSLKAWKDPVRLATTADITLTPSGTTSVDGVTVVDGDRVLVKNQSVTSENGIYVYDGTGLEYVRAADFDATSEIAQGTRVYVQEGTANAGKTFEVSTGTPTIGGALTFAEVVSGGGTVTLQDAYDDTTAVELFPTFFVKSLDASTNPLVIQSTLNPAVPFGNVLFLTPAAAGGANAETLAAANQGTTLAVFVSSNESGGTTQNLGTFLNSGTTTACLSLIQAESGSVNSGQGFLLIQNQDTTGGNNVPMIKMNHLAGSGTGNAVDIQFTARTSDPTNLVDGGLWYNSSDATLRYSEGTGSFRAVSAWEGAVIGPLTVDIHSSVNPLVFEASPQSVPVGSTLFYNDTANVNSIPLGILNNAAAGFGVIAENMTGASLTALAQFQNSGTVNAAGAVFVIQSAVGSTNNGQAFLVVQNQDTAGNNDVPLIRLNHLAGGGTGDAVDLQFTARTADPTNLVDGGLWFNTTDNQVKFSDGTAAYPLAHLEDGTNRGSLNLPVLSADPSAPQDGDVWLFDSGGVRAIRARMGGTTYGVTLT